MKMTLLALSLMIGSSAAADVISPQKFVSFTCLDKKSPRRKGSVIGTINFQTKKAKVDSNNGWGGTFLNDTYDFSNHFADAKFQINPANGWTQVWLKKINPANSWMNEFTMILQMQPGSSTAIIKSVNHCSSNPVTGHTQGCLGLSDFKGQSCEVNMN